MERILVCVHVEGIDRKIIRSEIKGLEDLLER